ncbi:hypothetical protein PIB30_082955 [Stylosanthes scabra]|uniref:Uncharacterized protein n=1 Tax=Stylosanthes scabra TaxID=79078 RepID=A0ABU6XS92_9FABA|nr:hypothetical protein [Stylosanthes scabra]
MFERALCDLGSSINLMPLYLMKKLGIKEMKPTKVILQMADKTTCMKINSVDPASTKPPDITNPRQECKAITVRSGKSTRNDIQNQESAEDSCSPPPKEKKKKEPVAYVPKPPYPQRLKAENKNKAPKKEPKEENATNDSMKFQLIQKVPYLPTIMGSNNKTYMITKDNKFFEPP